MKIWKKADQFYSFGSYHTAVEAYEEALPIIKNEGLFLQMYGKALNMNEEYQKSNQILQIAQDRLSNQIIQNAMGDNYKALGNYIAAEAAYEKSKHMIPSLLLPKYLMAKLYNESGQNQKAQLAAEEILNSPVKVESSATREIIRKMKKIINNQWSVTSKQWLLLIIVNWWLKTEITGKKKRKLTSSAAHASSSGSLSNMKGGNVTKVRI